MHKTNDVQTILLIEDSVDDSEATMRAFKKANLYNPVVWRSSGEEAMRYLRREGEFANDDTVTLPGLILLDLNMPGMDGRRVLKEIKQDKILRAIPVVILTTSSDERDIQASYANGANTFIQKPVSFEGLISAIKGLKEYWFEIALLPKDMEDYGHN